MKQLSLLLLAGLTTSCFAAQDTPEQTQPTELSLCWQLVKNYWSQSEAKDLKNMGAMEDCATRKKEMKALLADPKLTNADDRLALECIQRSLGTLERALQRQAKRQDKIQTFLERTEYAEETDMPSTSDDNNARREAFHAYLEEAIGHLNLIK